VIATALQDAEPIDTRRDHVVASYDVSGIREGGALDDITGFAAALCETPVALVTLIRGDTQEFLGRTGTDLPGTPRAISFCEHALDAAEVVEFTDLVGDPRFADNPLVTGGPQIRFYAGAPMRGDDGQTLGTLCVLDTVARDGLTPLQRQGLAVLATAALARLDVRRADRRVETLGSDARRALSDSEQRFRTLADTMPQMVWSTLPDGFHDYYNARWYEFTGAPEGTTDGEGWNDMFHPDDQDRAWAVWRHSLTTGDPYQIEYRLRHFDGVYRWVLGRALPIRDEGTGAITRWFGTCTDIHEQKLAMEEREVISQELSHRIKNIFAVIAGLVGFSARGRPEFRQVANDLRDRITALGRAHDFVRPHSAASRPEARQDSLHGLLGELFAAYRGDRTDRVAIDGDDVVIDDRSTTPLALLFHELATNATKYGALGHADGQVTVSVNRGDTNTTIAWTERGGPAVAQPARAGFGSQLIEMSAVRQLGGTVVRDWRAEGLAVRVTMPNAVFSRAG